MVVSIKQEWRVSVQDGRTGSEIVCVCVCVCVWERITVCTFAVGQSERTTRKMKGSKVHHPSLVMAVRHCGMRTGNGHDKR